MRQIPIDLFLSVIKHRYNTPEAVLRDFPSLSANTSLVEVMEENWAGIPLFEANQAWQESNPENQRWYFSMIGPGRLFDSYQKKKKVASHAYLSIMPDGTEVPINYDLWQIKDDRFPGVQEFGIIVTTCPSSGNTHYMYVDSRTDVFQRKDVKGVLAALAPCPYDKINHFYRQGEGYYFVPAPGAKFLSEPRILTGDEYFSKIRFES